jgi:glycosyltransferase involved in cell wall biosynthesis
MHTQLGKENKWGQNYWFVVPNYFDVNAWPLSLTPHVDTVGFFGRVYSGKGCAVVSAIAKRFPHVRFILCGQGDAKPFMTEPNVHYKPPIYGEERSKYLGSLQALVAPTQFIEPFCGAAVECQLCGTPAITVDFGAQTETIENFKTGLRCHTLQDFCVGVQMALDGKFDREYIRERAVKLYGMEEVGKKYEYTFKSIMDIHNGKNGWYSPDSYIDVTRSE